MRECRGTQNSTGSWAGSKRRWSRFSSAEEGWMPENRIRMIGDWPGLDVCSTDDHDLKSPTTKLPHAQTAFSIRGFKATRLPGNQLSSKRSYSIHQPFSPQSASSGLLGKARSFSHTLKHTDKFPRRLGCGCSLDTSFSIIHPIHHSGVLGQIERTIVNQRLFL